MRELFLGICILFLTGCATSNVSQSFSPKNLDKDGIVIFSITKTLSKKGEQYLSSSFAEVSLGYIGKNGKNGGKVTTDTSSGLFSSNSDFRDIKGKLFVIRLPSGVYHFDSWSIRTRGLGGDRFISSKDLKPITFEVKKNQVIYLGELNIDMIAQKNFFGISLVFGGELNIKDSFGRDMKVLQKNYPNIEIKEVIRDKKFITKW